MIVYHKIYSFFRDSGQFDATNKEQKAYINQFLSSAKESLEINVRLAEENSKKAEDAYIYEINPSFFNSRAGLYTFGAILCKQSNDENADPVVEAKMKEYIEKLKEMYDTCYATGR